MKARWLSALAVNAAFAGCSGETWVPSHVPAGGRALVVVAGEDDEPLQVSILDASSAPARFSSEDAPVFVYAFALQARDFVGVDGSALEREELDGTSIRLAGEGAGAGFGACGRCLAAFGRAPQPLLPGDSCPLPAFALVEARRVDAEGAATLAGDELRVRLERVRKRVLLERAGSCACTRADTSASPPPFRMEVAHPITPPPVETSALAPDGTLLVASTGVATAVLADGRTLELTDPELLQGDARATIAQSGPSGARFWLFSEAVHPRRRDYLVQGVEVAGDQLARFDARITGLDTAALKLRGVLQRPDGSAVIYGGLSEGSISVDERPFALECAANGSDTLACRSLVLPRCNVNDGVLTDFVDLEDGTIVAVRKQTSVIFGDGAVGSCDDELALTGGPGTRYRALNLRTFGVLGSRVYLCGVFLMDGDHPVNLVATTTVAGPLAGRPLLEWEIVHHGPIECTSFARVPGEPDQLYFGLRNGEVMILDRAGRVVLQPTPSTAVIPGLDQPARALRPLPAGGLLVEAGAWDRPAASIYLGPPLRRVYGPSAVMTGDVDVMLERGGEIWAFDHAGRVSRLTLSGDEVQVSPLAEQPLLDRDRILRVALDSRSDRALAVTSAWDGSGGSLFWIDLATGAAERVEGAPRGHDYRDVVEMAPGRFLVVASNRAYAVEDDSVLELDIDMDDPSTPGLEADALLELISAGTSAGLAWVSGHSGQLFRARGAPPVLERFQAIDRFTDLNQGYSPFGVLGRYIMAPCPDQLLVAGGPTTAELRPDAADPLGLRFDYFRGFGVDSAVLTLRTEYRELAWLDDRGGQLYGRALSGHVFAPLMWEKAPFWPRSGVVLPDGRLLIASSQHRYAISRAR